MEAIIERVGGVDVGQATVVATLLVGAAHERAKKETRTFRIVTRELLEMREWFIAKGVTHVAMEGTGVYWRPVYSRLEDAFEMILGNAQHIKHVPGRKTDVKDSEWLADLARHGLIAKSFVPPKPPGAGGGPRQAGGSVPPPPAPAPTRECPCQIIRRDKPQARLPCAMPP